MVFQFPGKNVLSFISGVRLKLWNLQEREATEAACQQGLASDLLLFFFFFCGHTPGESVV